MEEKEIKIVEVFDPPMCCSSGVCGPNVDKKLVKFNVNLAWLSSQGIEVQRYNPTQQYEAFVGNAAVVKALNDNRESCLPLILVNGEVVSRGGYPDRAELAAIVGISDEDATTEEER